EPIVPATAAGPAVRAEATPTTVRTPLGQRSKMARPLAVGVAAAISLLAVTTPRAPPSSRAAPPSSRSAADSTSGSNQATDLTTTAPASTVPTPPLSDPASDKTTPGRTPVVYAFDARVVAGNQKSQQECKCRVVLANGRIIWRAED